MPEGRKIYKAAAMVVDCPQCNTRIGAGNPKTHAQFATCPKCKHQFHMVGRIYKQERV